MTLVLWRENILWGAFKKHCYIFEINYFGTGRSASKRHVGWKNNWKLITGGCNKRGMAKYKHTIPCLQKAHICILLLFLVMSNIASEKGNKLQNWSDILIVVTKHSNFLNETTTIWLFLGCYMSVNRFLLFCRT